MATDKPRFSVTFSDDSYKKIQKYKKENNISTQSKAVAQLVSMAICKMEESGGIKKPRPEVAEAKKVAEDYLSLDRWGKQVVRSVIDGEKARCEAEAAKATQKKESGAV